MSNEAITVKVEGLKEVTKLFDTLPNKLQKSIISPALRVSSKPMLAVAKARVPVDTGRLRDQLKIVRLRKFIGPHEIAVGIKPVFEKTKNGEINQYYGRFIHDGTKERKPKNKKVLAFKNSAGELIFTRSAKAIPANPYLVEAYNAEANNTFNAFEKNLFKSVDKFMKKQTK